MTDYRAELQPLFDALNARAALAEPEPPDAAFVVATDKELLEFAGERFPYALRSCYDLGRQHGAALAAEPEPATEESSAVQAADGEVAELVVCLHRLARADWLSDETADILTRAADLLEQFSKSTSI
jgi:hypothetical protein